MGSPDGFPDRRDPRGLWNISPPPDIFRAPNLTERLLFPLAFKPRRILVQGNLLLCICFRRTHREYRTCGIFPVEAMRAYARQAKNKQLEVDAAEIRISAERRLGELIKAQKDNVGLAKGAAGIGKSASAVPGT